MDGPTNTPTPHEQIDVAYAQAVVWLKEGKNLGLLTLYEGRIQRRVEKNLAIVRQLQQDRKAALQQAVEEATLLAQLAASKGETFDIERDFPREALPPQFVFSLCQIARLVAHHRHPIFDNRTLNQKLRRAKRLLPPTHPRHATLKSPCQLSMEIKRASTVYGNRGSHSENAVRFCGNKRPPGALLRQTSRSSCLPSRPSLNESCIAP